MTYTIDDIQIFIATHNRAEYLKESIESILNQTVHVDEITVLDNESTDNTEEVVKSYSQKGVKYVKTTGFLGNFNKGKELASKAYCMIFHDDDILHPEYLEFVLELLNKYDNVSLIATKFKEFWDNKKPKIISIPKKDYYFFQTQNDFVKYMYFVERVAYANAIYRTKELKQYDLEYDKYSKFNDWPFMMKFTATGNSIIINEPMVYSRFHIGQDSQTFVNTHSIDQCINWVKFFNDIFTNNNDYESLKIAKQKNLYFLKGRYMGILDPKIKDKISLKEFLDIANNNGIYNLARTEKRFSKEYRRYVKRIKKNNFISQKDIITVSIEKLLNIKLNHAINVLKRIKQSYLLLLTLKFHNLKSNFEGNKFHVK